MDTRSVVERFNETFNSRDVEAIMALMSDDVVFESTEPPDGRRYEGQSAVRAFWAEFFRSAPRARFDAEDISASDDRCTVLWRFTFDEDDPAVGHVRGVDVFRVRDGKIAEKLSYVKG